MLLCGPDLQSPLKRRGWSVCRRPDTVTCGRGSLGHAGSQNESFLILNLELAQSGVTLSWGFVHLLEGRAIVFFCFSRGSTAVKCKCYKKGTK